MPLTLADIRTRARYAMKNAGDVTSIPDLEIDIGLQDCLADLVFDTKITRTTTAGTALTADSYAGTISITSFEPFRVITCWLQGATDTYEPLAVIGHGELVAMRAAEDRTGEPRYIAFLSDTAFEVYPAPDDADTYTPKFDWYPPATTFTAGGAGTPTFNIKDDVLYLAARWGVPSYVQGNMPEMKYVEGYAAKWAEFKGKLKGSAGASRGVRSIERGE